MDHSLAAYQDGWKAELFDWFKEAAKAFGRYDDPKLVGQSFETITVSEP
jgi:hypothetical protein